MTSSRLAPQVAQATAAGDGSITFTFGAPPVGKWWTGTLNIPGAPQSATFALAVPAGAQPLGSWTGNNPFGPVQAYELEAITVTGNGLTPGVAYSAMLVGSEDDAGTVPAAFPAATGSGNVTNPILLDTLTVPGNTIVQRTYQLPPGVRAVAVWASTGAGSVYLTGGTTGIVYLNNQPIGNNANAGSGHQPVLRSEVEQVLDPTINVQYEGQTGPGGAAVSFGLIAEFSNPSTQLALLSSGAGPPLVAVPASTSFYNPPASAVVTNVDSTIITNPNPDRIQFYLSNPSTTDVWLGYGNAAVAGKGLWLPAGSVLIEDRCLAAVHAITAAGSATLGVLVSGLLA